MAQKIGMTSFIDYFVATSATKVSKVRATKRMMEGDGFDHWMLFRQAAIDALVAGGDKSKIHACVANASRRRLATYTACGTELVKWMGKKTFSATAMPKGKVWRGPGLDVSVNPEVRIVINGQPEVLLKFYFKTDPLSKRAADPMLRLIEQTYGKQRPAAILDVRRRKLHTGPAPKPADLDLLLNAEATGFSTVYAGL